MRVGLTTSIATAIAVGVLIASGGGPSGINLWMSSTGNDTTCVRGDQTKPCLTFTGALAKAQANDVVRVGDGFYGCETISNNSQTVTFEGDGTGTGEGNVPWVACTSDAYALHLDSSSNLTFDNIYIAGLTNCGNCNNGGERHLSSNITLVDTHITCADDGAHFLVDSEGSCGSGIEQGADNFSMTGGEIGPTTEGIGNGGSHTWGENTTFDGVTFNENRCGPPSGEGCHSEQLFVYSGNPLTIKNSGFHGWSGTAAIYFSENQTVGAGNVLLENNFVGPSTGNMYGIYIGTLTAAGGTKNFDIRYNTVYNGIYSDLEPSDGSTFVGNISGYVQCKAGFATYDHNVFGDDLGRGCGTNSQTETSTAYTCSGCHFDTSNGHLQAGAKALGYARPGDYPATDREGTARPQGAAADAGSNESNLG